MPAAAPPITPHGVVRVTVMAAPMARHAKNNARPTPLFPRRCRKSGFMTLSSFLVLLALQLAQLLQQILDREAARAGAPDEFAHQLAELPLVFDFIPLHLLLRDESAGALLGLQHTANFELPIGPHDGVRIDRQIDGHL